MCFGCVNLSCQGSEILSGVVDLRAMMMAGGYRKWAVVGLLWIVTCVNYMDRMTLFAIFPLLHQQMHLSNVELAMLGSVFLWAHGLCSPAGGYLGDRFNRKSVVLASLVIFSV
jgi:MFS family permease